MIAKEEAAAAAEAAAIGGHTDTERLPLNLRAGLWALCACSALGLGLETLHAFKLGFYLDVGNETRRLLWRLAHAHGALLGLLNVCYALATRAWPGLAV